MPETPAGRSFGIHLGIPLEDHFCGKRLGVPMGCDVCYTNHAEADQNDMDMLLTLHAVAGLGWAGQNFLLE